MSTIQLYLFGNFEIYCENYPLDKPPTLKSQSLLAYLILHRQQPQTREWLVNLFWGDRPAHKARSSLSTALWHIRRSLPHQDILLANPRTVQFDPQADLWLDTQAFEINAGREDVASLQKAVDLYRGDFLSNFYDDWIVDERYRLEMVFTDTLARLMMKQEVDKEYRTALTTALHLLAYNPLREDAHQLAMRAYCQLGQRNAALDQYHYCQQVLQQELGIEPMAETTGFYQAILHGEIDIKPPLDPFLIQLPTIPTGRNPLDITVASPLVGREQETFFLQQCWQDIQAGEGRFVLINGGAGVGKTRLIEEFANQVRWQAGNVLWGHCYEFESTLPYQPIAEAIRTVLSTLPPDKWKNLPSWSLAEVARLIPEITEYYRNLSEPIPIDSDQALGRLFSGVNRLLGELSVQGGLLLVLEDLHWASDSTLQMLHYLARHLKNQAVFIIGTLRPDELDAEHPLRKLQLQLRNDDLCQPQYLDLLSSEAVANLVEEMSGTGEVVLPLANRLYLETEGNPFFIMEIIKELFERKLVWLENDIWQGDFSEISKEALPLPFSVHEAIQSRVHRLGSETQEALRLAAVLGQTFDFDLLKMVWNQDEERTLDALDNFLRHQLIREGMGPLDQDYAFSHQKIQEVVYSAIPLRRRQHMHGLVGKAMEQIYEPHLVISELAFHFEQAQYLDRNLAEKAIGYLREAGELAAAQYANAEAVSYFSRALNLIPKADAATRFDFILAREKINDLRGERVAQVKDLTELERLANRLDINHRIRTALRQGNYYLAIGDLPAGHSHLLQALDWAREVGDPHHEATSLNLLGSFQLVSGNATAALKRYEQALRIHRSIGNHLGEAENLSALGTANHLAGNYPAAKNHYQQALAISQKIKNVYMVGSNLSVLGRLSRQLGHLEAALDYNDQALIIMRNIGHPNAEAYCLHELGNIHNDLGNGRLAKQKIEQAITVFSAVGDPRGESYAQIDLGLVYHHLGEDEKALAHCRQGCKGLQTIGDRWGEGGGLNYMGQILEGLGDWESATEAYTQALSIKREINQHAWAIEDLAGLARVALAQGNQNDALKHTDEALTWIDQYGIAGLELPLLVYLTASKVLAAAGYVERAEAVLVDAYDILMERANKIKDNQLRCSFLENVITHREIVAAIETHVE